MAITCTEERGEKVNLLTRNTRRRLSSCYGMRLFKASIAVSTKEPGNSKGTLCKNVFVLIESKTLIRIHRGVYGIYKPSGP